MNISFVQTPADLAVFDTPVAEAAVLLGTDAASVAALAADGLQHRIDPVSGPLFDYTDVINAGVHSRSGVTVPELAQRLLLRFAAGTADSWLRPLDWTITVVPPGGFEGDCAAAVPDLTAEGVQALDVTTPPMEQAETAVGSVVVVGERFASALSSVGVRGQQAEAAVGAGEEWLAAAVRSVGPGGEQLAAAMGSVGPSEERFASTVGSVGAGGERLAAAVGSLGRGEEQLAAVPEMGRPVDDRVAAPVVAAGHQRAPYRVRVRLTGERYRVGNDLVRAAFDEQLADFGSGRVVYQAISERLRGDHRRAWELGVADCVVASAVLTDRLRAHGLTARTRRGYLLGLVGSDHAWTEVYERDHWRPLDVTFAHLAGGTEFREACCGSRFNRLLPGAVAPGVPLLVDAAGGPAPKRAFAGVTSRLHAEAGVLR
ncbi:transglutaminase domain-containing protein [Nocardia inohanensis]|uniref:transglutaminase domain-containing protein n=1 Tax=Nocardia inohanensis TaxID=209246 RepID=UPI00082A14F7|nr:transglutaminase domain-containing protein [Nocardia inohanensis]